MPWYPLSPRKLHSNAKIILFSQHSALSCSGELAGCVILKSMMHYLDILWVWFPLFIQIQNKAHHRRKAVIFSYVRCQFPKCFINNLENKCFSALIFFPNTFFFFSFFFNVRIVIEVKQNVSMYILDTLSKMRHCLHIPDSFLQANNTNLCSSISPEVLRMLIAPHFRNHMCQKGSVDLFILFFPQVSFQ